jgi:hypothetical protein
MMPILGLTKMFIISTHEIMVGLAHFTNHRSISSQKVNGVIIVKVMMVTSTRAALYHDQWGLFVTKIQMQVNDVHVVKLSR